MQASEYVLHAPAGVVDMSDAGQAAMAQLRDGFAEAGAGQSLARELFSDAVLAHQGGAVPISQRSAETDLRREWGPRYDAQVEAAKGLVHRAAQCCPEIIGFLERIGLGNDPAFIRKVAAAAGRRR